MTLTDRVRQLFEAENQADRKKAEAILAPDFVAITRRNGEEESRQQLLEKIEPDPDEFQVWESGDIGVVRSLVRTRDRCSPVPTTRPPW
jgi:Domain of unknown function (DUF4440)